MYEKRNIKRYYENLNHIYDKHKKQRVHLKINKITLATAISYKYYLQTFELVDDERIHAIAGLLHNVQELSLRLLEIKASSALVQKPERLDWISAEPKQIFMDLPEVTEGKNTPPRTVITEKGKKRNWLKLARHENIIEMPAPVWIEREAEERIAHRLTWYTIRTRSMK